MLSDSDQVLHDGASRSAERRAIMELGQRTRIAAVDGLRAWAVLLVFAVHFCGWFTASNRAINLDDVSDPRLLEASTALLFWLFYSHYGVYIFFVISGFVIARSFMVNETVSGYLRFLAHRALRVYPAFLISLIPAFFVSAHYLRIKDISFETILQNIVFLNGVFAFRVLAINSVTWSLFYEFAFYIAFPLLYLIAIRSKRHAKIYGLLLWLGLIATLALCGFREWFLFLPFLLGSFAGLQTDEALHRLSTHVSDNYIIAAYLTITTVACFFLPLPAVSDAGLLWPPASSAFVLLLSGIVTLAIIRATYRNGILSKALTCAPMLALGRISYSFFLVHGIVLAFVFSVTSRDWAGSLLRAAALAAVSFVVSVISAATLYQIAERPYYAFRRDGSRPR